MQFSFFAVKVFLANFDFSAPKVPIRRYTPLLRGTSRHGKNQNLLKNTRRVGILGLTLFYCRQRKS